MLLYFFQSAFGARITGECIWTLEDCQMQGFLQLAATLCPLAYLLYLFEYATFTPPSLFHLFFFFFSLSFCNRSCNVTELLLCLPVLPASIISSGTERRASRSFFALAVQKGGGKKEISHALSGMS